MPQVQVQTFANASAPIVNLDDSASPGSGVLRGADGSTKQTGMNSGTPASGVPSGSAYVSNAGSSFQAGGALTGSSTLTNASARRQTLDATSAAFPVTLPAISASAKLEFEFYKIDGAHSVTLTGTGSDTIQLGATTANTAVLSTQGVWTRVWNDGSIWRAG